MTTYHIHYDPLTGGTYTVYALESACVKIVWQREFLLQEVKVLRLEVWGETLL
jgi:hypothetical protein